MSNTASANTYYLCSVPRTRQSRGLQGFGYCLILQTNDDRNVAITGYKFNKLSGEYMRPERFADNCVSAGKDNAYYSHSTIITQRITHGGLWFHIPLMQLTHQFDQIYNIYVQFTGVPNTTSYTSYFITYATHVKTVITLTVEVIYASN